MSAEYLFADSKRRIYVHSLKEILLCLLRYRVTPPAEMFLDVSLAAYLMEPPEPDRREDWRKFQLSSLVRRYLTEPYRSFSSESKYRTILRLCTYGDSALFSCSRLSRTRRCFSPIGSWKSCWRRCWRKWNIVAWSWTPRGLDVPDR